MTATRGVAAAGRAPTVIEGIASVIDAWRFAAKRIVGEEVAVEADCFADGREVLVRRLRYRCDADTEWHEAPMTALGNDRGRGVVTATAPGRYRYTVTAWVEHVLSWQHDFSRRVDPGDIGVAARVGAELIEAAAARAAGDDRKRLVGWAKRLPGATGL